MSSTTICIKTLSRCSTDAMNYKELEQILGEYVRRFDEFDNAETRDEGYKWRAIAQFQRNWNIDAGPDSFLQMFKSATKYQINLFDGHYQQPLGGIRKLLKDKENYGFIQQQFSLLFSDDGGDYDQRQERAQLFTEAVNSRLLQSYPTEEACKHKVYDAINYLSFWRPEDNFICKPASANKVADIIDFIGDIGWGEDFSLSEYYRMCNEILAALDNFPELIERNEARRLRESPDLSDAASRHIIVYDVIYCAYQYDLNGVKTRPSIPKKERAAAAEAKKQREEKEREISALREQLQAAEAGGCSLPDLSGKAVHHKAFGAGTVQSCADGRLAVEFQSRDKPVVFEYLPDKKRNCVTTGFIAPDSEETANSIRSAFDREEEIQRLSALILSAEKELRDLLGK